MISKPSVKRCIIDSSELIEILNLGMHPYADTFIPSYRLEESEPVFPLRIGLCKECSLVQLTNLTEPSSRYDLYDYSYTSANSEYAKSHWKEYFRELLPLRQMRGKWQVMEIGSNDGYLLNLFASEADSILGIDSSRFMAEEASKQGILTLNLIFSEATSLEVFKNYGKQDLIIANNVFNHSNNPLDFLIGVQNLLQDDGLFVFEVPYWLYTVDTFKYDQIYHEHISYFTILSIFNIVKLTELHIQKIEVNEYHGGTLKVFLGKREVEIDSKTLSLFDLEQRANLQDFKKYQEFAAEIINTKFKLLKKLCEIRITFPDSDIILIGAAAKANTFINFHKFDNDLIHCITDSSPHKIGKYTPLSRIPIYSDEYLRDSIEPFVLITSWNISDTLSKKIVGINPGVRFINAKE